MERKRREGGKGEWGRKEMKCMTLTHFHECHAWHCGASVGELHKCASVCLLCQQLVSESSPSVSLVCSCQAFVRTLLLRKQLGLGLGLQ